jgi:hypothetical protein
MRRAFTAALLALAVGAQGAVPAIAQDPPNGLVTALGSVPDTLEIRQQLVSWIDYAALVDSREGAAHPASIEELLALLDANDPAARLWMAAFNGAASGSGRLLRSMLRGGPEWPRILGFDFTDVRSELAFGQPPGDGLVIQGDFEPVTIGAALAARDFTSTDGGPFTIWCRADGCDMGLEVDAAGRDPADPFGGDLGRRQPLAVSDGTLLSSAAIDTVDAMLATTGDILPSLADDGDYASVAEALAGEGTLIQATLVPGTHPMLFDQVVVTDERSTPDEVRRRLDELAEDFEPIASTSLLGIGDAATDTEQVVTLALAYPTLAEAQTAAEVLPRRLETMTSNHSDRSWKEDLVARGLDSSDARAVEREDGEGALALLTFRAPKAGPDPDPDVGMLKVSSNLYRLFAQMIQGRDTAWLAPSLPSLS